MQYVAFALKKTVLIIFYKNDLTEHKNKLHLFNYPESACLKKVFFACVNINNKENLVRVLIVLDVNFFAAFFVHKSPYRSHSSAGTTSCPDRGSAL